VTSLTVGWIAGIILLALGAGVGFVVRPRYDQWRNTTPASATPDSPPPGARNIPRPAPVPLRAVPPTRPAPPQQPSQVARTPTRPAGVPPLRKPLQPVPPRGGKHRPETVPTQAMPVVKPTKEVS